MWTSYLGFPAMLPLAVLLFPVPFPQEEKAPSPAVPQTEDSLTSQREAFRYVSGDDSYSYAGHRPSHAFELAYSFESLWVAYRGRFQRGKGYGTVGGFRNEDDDAAFLVRIMRFGEPRNDVPLGLGVGLGLYGGFIDQPNVDFYALTLSAYADYAFNTAWPLRLSAEFSFSPDIATTSKADDLLDLLARLEVELSDFAGAFIGGRLFEVTLEGGQEIDLDSSIYVGIRLWF
ncbi:MAG: hypothetical protein CMJ89_08825 [Planctomycetes bacterium]|nr:hypothetical protein [Planctomycetota bacterium]